MENKQQLAEQVHQVMDELENDMIELDQRGQAIARRTLLVVKLAIVLTIGVALVNFALIFAFSGEMTKSIDNMVNMYERFGTMSEDMRIITSSVESMGDNTEGIPTIATSMVVMRNNMYGMQQDMAQMTGNIVAMDSTLGYINRNTGDMSRRFMHLNHTVWGMTRNVHQMSGPLRMMPGAQ